MKTFKQNVGENLAFLRKQKKMTQLELAEQFNYSDKAISKWENGETLPDLEVLYQLCEFYGVTLDFLTDQEASSQKEKYEKETSNSVNSIAISLLITSVVWMIVTIIFVYLLIINNVLYWPIFIWGVPASALVLIVMNRFYYRSRLFYFILYSILVWGLITSVALTAYYSVTSLFIWPLFLIGIPMQVSLILWYLAKKK